MRFHTKAGLLYLLPAIAVLVVWYLLLFEGNVPGVTPKSTFAFVLTEGARPWWFRWLFVLPFLCFTLAAAYQSRLAALRVGSVVLLSLGVALAAATWLTVSSEIALFTTLPLAYAFLSTKESFSREREGT
ncbi:MAG TPA: hypothetical protein VNS61_01050 [Caldimonas sp.]|jgi:hypothetical protein|nr:hypothetical protein [Caldimonas sp.]